MFSYQRGIILFRGAFTWPKGKAFEKGRIFQNLEILMKILFFHPMSIAKEFEMSLPKHLQKQAKWCKCDPDFLTISKHSYVLRTAFTSIAYAVLSKLQTSYNYALYICFGSCWHQSPKKGRLKGKWL
jgi:hypothetical protein